MKATKKRYADCQTNPHHVFNNGEVELIIPQEGYQGVMIQSRDGAQRYRVSAHMHRGCLVLDITTPDESPAVVIGNCHSEEPRRKLLIYQGDTKQLADILPAFPMRSEDANEAVAAMNVRNTMMRA